MPSIDEPIINPASFGKCPVCEQPRTSFYWCKPCEAKSFMQTWSDTGNALLNDLFRLSQRDADQSGDFIEHIPYNQLEEAAPVDSGPKSGAHSTVSSAIWLEGPPINWNDYNGEWERTGPTRVALKRIHNSQGPDASIFFDKVTQYLKALQNVNVADTFGISINPRSKELVVVMKWYAEGNLYDILENYRFTIEGKVRLLFDIAGGLESLHHGYNLHHGNLHSGNILVEIDDNGEPAAKLADVGISGPANQLAQTSDGVFGVLPYVAPEVLQGEALGKESDMYAFGILMWQIATSRRPFSEVPHDLELATHIVTGLRPYVTHGLFAVDYVERMTKCWDCRPGCRPAAPEILNWLSNYSEEVKLQNEAVYDDALSDIHGEACYTSRWLSFPELRAR